MTVHSMTGFAHISAEIEGKRVDVELRSVNHRFLDVQFKMPDDLRFLEGSLREIIAAQASRGKVECRIQLNRVTQDGSELSLNDDLVSQLVKLNDKWQKKHKNLAKLSTADILKFPGVLVAAQSNQEILGKTVQQLVAKAAEDFAASRAREGEKLQEHILTRLQKMEGQIAQLSQVFPELLQTHMNKTRARLAEAVANVDEERLKQEFALFLQKADVDEEFSRLHTHIAEVRRIVTEQKGSIGKRLDFLMQELNREANTLGSKAIATECTQTSVELKVLIEQMREQVQNIE